MAKHTKEQIASVPDGNGASPFVAQRTTYEDNMLPSAEEMAKYNDVSPDIVRYILEQAKAEQEHRHSMDHKTADIVGSSEFSKNKLNSMGLSFAFIIVVLGLFFSAFLIHSGKDISGSILAGATIFSGAGMFIFREKKSNKKNGVPPT